MIIQAGQSGRGRAFAVRWAEVVFAIYPNLEFGARAYAETRALAESAGRDPDSFRIAPACYTTVGETQTIAEDKAAFVDKLSQPVDTLALLSEALNFDFATKAPDDPFTDEELRSISGLQAIRDRVIRLSGNPNPTRDDFVRYSNRGTVREMPHFVGTAATVADRLQEWFERPGLRRLRPRRHPRPRHLRGLRPPRRPRTAAPRRLPPGLRRRNPAGEPRARGVGTWQYATTWTRRPASLTFSDTESRSRKSKKCWPLRVRIGRDETALGSRSGARDRGDISG